MLDSRLLPYVGVRPVIDSCYWRHRLRHAHPAAVNTIQLSLLNSV